MHAGRLHACRQRSVAACALFSKDEKAARNQSARDMSRRDAKLLQESKGLKKGEKLSPEQEAALRRRIRGTGRDFFKDWVDVEGDYVEQGYVSGKGGAADVPALPFLIAIVVAILGATGYVVSQTG